jgi:type VI secretion system protein ImpJ
MFAKPHWTHGLDLGHSHFEMLDRYHEQLVDHRLTALFDHAWGIHEIRWDTRALGAGQVALRKLDAILPDGMLIACDDAQGVPGPAIALGDLAPGAAVQVHLGVRQVRAGSNVDTPDSKERRRYRRETVLMPDLTGGSEPSSIEGLRPNVYLFLEGEPRQDFVTLPCARVVRSASGQLAYDEAFVPPVLSINASSYLRRELRRAFDALVARQGIASRSSPHDATEVVRRWLGSIIGSFVPRVADLTHHRVVHPHTAYTVLAELVGALAPFTSIGTIPIPPFAFDRLGPVFARLFSDLAMALDAVGAENYRRLPLVRSDPTTLFVDLKEPAIFRQDFLLSVSGADVDDLRVRVPQQCKVGAWPQLPEILKSATTGVPLKHEPRPPGALPGGAGTLYFRLQRSEAFELVVKHGQMGIFHGPGLPITDMALFTVDPGAT